MHVLLAGNVPKFHVAPGRDAVNRMKSLLWQLPLVITLAHELLIKLRAASHSSPKK